MLERDRAVAHFLGCAGRRGGTCTGGNTSGATAAHWPRAFAGIDRDRRLGHRRIAHRARQRERTTAGCGKRRAELRRRPGLDSTPRGQPVGLSQQHAPEHSHPLHADHRADGRGRKVHVLRARQSGNAVARRAATGVFISAARAATSCSWTLPARLPRRHRCRSKAGPPELRRRSASFPHLWPIARWRPCGWSEGHLRSRARPFELHGDGAGRIVGRILRQRRAARGSDRGRAVLPASCSGSDARRGGDGTGRHRTPRHQLRRYPATLSPAGWFPAPIRKAPTSPASSRASASSRQPRGRLSNWLWSRPEASRCIR